MKRFLRGLNHYIVFFLMVAFLVTCCIMLFTRTLMDSLGIVLTGANLGTAAKLTFGNVILLSVLFTLIDTARRKLTVERTARRIAEAAKRIVAGDFSARVTRPSRFSNDEHFVEIIDCFNRMAEELSGVETLRTDFISNVSHEMKTPLAVMQNYGTLLQSPDLPEDKRVEYARGITDSSRRLADMVTNILKLNKLENQQIFPHAQKYDLGEQLCESLLQYESVWERENIEIETDIAEDVQVCADRELLSLVWNNLLSNAFKFTPAGGTVSLTLTATEHHAVVRVQDTGCGMSAETGAHIFEKFYQGDKENCLKHTTLREYASILKKHLIPAFGDTDISVITIDDVQRFMNSKADMSRKSIHEMVMVLGMILEAAVEDGLMPHNPARSKRLRNPSRKVSTRNALTTAELTDIISHLHMLTEERDRMMLVLLIYTGMRRNEVLGLRWGDIDWGGETIHVLRGVTYKGNLPQISTPKTAAGVRQIPIPSVLRQWLSPGDRDCYVVGGQTSPISEKTFIRMWQRIERTIDLHGATPHVFRHTYMTFAQRAQIPVKTLQAIGGYADLATLQDRYVHTQHEDIEAARAAIEDMFLPAKSEDT